MSSRIVLIYADTGGGHRSTAQAIQEGLLQRYDCRVTTSLVNATPYMPYPYNTAERIYPVAIARARNGYAAFWRITNNQAYTAAARRAMQLSGKRLIDGFFRDHPADVYVSCHPLVNQLLPGTQALRASGAPFLAMVSDLATVHTLFWSRDIDHTMVPTEQARALAVRHGVDARRITVTGQPVLTSFAARARAGRAKRAALGLSNDLPMVLLMGGGDGMGRLVDTALSIAYSGLAIQLVVICGRNERARAALSDIRSGVPVRALGFTDQVPEYMGAADVFVSKAGPGAICEAFAAGLPMVLYDAVPGQESGNIELVTRSGAGVWRPNPVGVVRQLSDWLSDSAARARAAQAALANARPDAALSVAAVVGHYAFDTDIRSHASNRMTARLTELNDVRGRL